MIARKSAPWRRRLSRASTLRQRQSMGYDRGTSEVRPHMKTVNFCMLLALLSLIGCHKGPNPTQPQSKEKAAATLQELNPTFKDVAHVVDIGVRFREPAKKTGRPN